MIFTLPLTGEMPCSCNSLIFIISSKARCLSPVILVLKSMNFLSKSIKKLKCDYFIKANSNKIVVYNSMLKGNATLVLSFNQVSLHGTLCFNNYRKSIFTMKIAFKPQSLEV